MTSPGDSNLGQRWWPVNLNIPTSGFLRLQAEEDVNKVTHRCGRLDCLREPSRFASGHVAADRARIDIEWSELETDSC